MDSTRHRDTVRRSLFGPVDHEQLRRDLTQKLREITEQDSRRWNFNFQTETPLAGRFQWEEIPADRAAAPYQEEHQEEHQAKGDAGSPHAEGDDRLSGSEEGAGTDQENCSSISNKLKSPVEVTPVRRKRTLPKSAAKPRSNARITDFFVKRRRASDTSAILNTLHTIEAALCKTIR